MPTPNVRKPRGEQQIRHMRGRPREVVRLMFDQDAKRDLEAIRQAYIEIVERPVSLSIILRRALSLLHTRLDAIRETEAFDAEKAAVLDHVR